MTKEDIEKGKLDIDRMGSLHKLAKAFHDLGFFRNCLNCDQWQKNYTTKEQRCGKFQAMPPPEVLVVGCEHHSDLIPF